MLKILAVIAFWCFGLVAAQAATVEVEGVSIKDSATVGGKKLVLNGAGYLKRGYFKTCVVSLYAVEKRNSLQAFSTQSGPKRLEIHMLREITGSAVSTAFINDYKAVSSNDEFVKMINEVSAVGSLFGYNQKINKGDVYWLDWTPGLGMSIWMNGELGSRGVFKPYLNTESTELLFQIFLRIHAGSIVTEELRQNLMGTSSSMQSTATATPSAVAPTTSR